MKKFAFGFAILTLAVASAATTTRYKVTISAPAEVGGKVLKAGEYTIEMKDNRAVIKGNKETVEADAHIENEARKYSTTAVRYTGEGASVKIDEVRIGGTTTKVVFSKTQAAGN